MLDSLKIIYQMIEEVNQKSFGKESTLRKHLSDPIFGDTLKKVLSYMINPKLIFPKVRISYVLYFSDKVAAENQHVEGIFKMLDYIAAKEDDLSDEEILFLERISSSDPETVEVVTRIINKFSGCGLTNEIIKEILEET